MEAAVRGADVLVVAPTGMGKRYAMACYRWIIADQVRIRERSLCFQVPAVADHHGITVVISPLLCKASHLLLTSKLTSPFLFQH